MNIRMTGYILGILLFFEGIFMLVPTLTAAVYHEPELLLFAVIAGICIAAGAVITRFKPANKNLFARDGFVIVALSWVVLSLIGALPFYISGTIPKFVDAMFEAVSGFTTTGASILHDLTPVPKCMLMWRSFTHWVGGMGVLVFIMAILPLAGGQNMYLMKAESPGPSVTKLVPRVRQTAMMLYLLYFVMTVAEFVLLLIGKMPLFDAINIAVGTAGTGGFACNPEGMPYSPFCINVITVFMLLFAVNFSCYFLFLQRKFKEGLTDELKVFLGILVFSIVTITLNVRHLPMFSSTGEALMHSSFTIGSLISSTGFSTVDFNQFPVYSKTLLVILMFVGACAGSTGGGIKVSRFQIMFKTIKREIQSYIHPRTVKTITIDGKAVGSDVEHSVALYFFIYLVIFVVSMFIVAIEGHDLVTVFTSVAATLNNIGPGLSLVGPTCNYGFFSNLSKWVMIFDMLAGRLELLPIIVFLTPTTYRGILKKSVRS